MPVIKIQHVCSFSSEDPSHPAENLLSLETYRKWKCAAAGEKQAVVVLQFEKATQIHSIDIGNDGSAFTEVLVARSTSPDEYQVLLVTSTFMSPVDSKAWSNTNRVRIFGKEKLSKGVAEQKWDRVKVICTQPFNKTEKYGLAFIKFHSPPDSSDDGDAPTPSKSPQKKLGAFSLRESTKDLPSGSLFFHKEQPKTAQVSTSPSAAARARMASAAALKTDQSDSPRRKGDQSKTASKSVDAKKSSPPSSSSKRPGSEKHSSATPPAKKSKAADSSAGSKLCVQDPSSQIMKGVVLSLSGFKNPFRGELREKAVEMGAQYEPDWSPSCTHLVCAFPNTPKFNQVKAKGGLIVKKEWVLDSHVKKRRLPARKYRLSSGNGSSSSEDERYDRKEGDIFRRAGSSGGDGSHSDTAAASSATAKKNGTGEAVKDTHAPETEDTLPLDEGTGAGRDKGPYGGSTDEEDPYGGSTDEEDMDTDVVVKRKPLPPPTLDDNSSECDTDDEIERVRQQQRERGDGTRGSTAEEDSGQGNAKAEDSSAAIKRSLTDLPDFFSKCRFLLYGTFSPADRRLVSRYITAYSGHMEEYMNEKVTHVLTQEAWDQNFDQVTDSVTVYQVFEDHSNTPKLLKFPRVRCVRAHFYQALTENSSLAFVRPKWIFVCHAKQSCVPYQPYIVVPT